VSGHTPATHPGGYFKREGAPVKKETLTCRLIDRPIDTLPRRVPNEVQVICLVISGDQENDPDVWRSTAPRRALSVGHPVRRAHRRRAGRLVDGKLIANPRHAAEGIALELVIAATRRQC